MSDEEFRCSQCGAHKRCRGGESAHRDNWYCPQCERIERLQRELSERGTCTKLACEVVQATKTDDMQTIERLKRELHDAHNEKVKAIGEFGLAVQRAEKAEADRDEYKMMFETTEEQLNRHIKARATAEAIAKLERRKAERYGPCPDHNGKDRGGCLLCQLEKAEARVERLQAAIENAVTDPDYTNPEEIVRKLRAALAEEDDAGSDDRSA